MKRINKLNTLKEAQNEFSRLIKAYYRDEIETPKFKTLVYAFSVLLNYQKTEKEQQLEQRLTELESKVGL
jgi:RNase P protein component